MCVCDKKMQKGVTALLKASKYGHVETVALLLECKADCHVQNQAKNDQKIKIEFCFQFICSQLFLEGCRQFVFFFFFFCLYLFIYFRDGFKKNA